MLPLSTLKRTDAQSVLLNWTQSKVKQTDKQMSGARRLSGRVGGQAPNSLPTVQHRKQWLIRCFRFVVCVVWYGKFAIDFSADEKARWK